LAHVLAAAGGSGRIQESANIGVGRLIPTFSVLGAGARGQAVPTPILGVWVWGQAVPAPILESARRADKKRKRNHHQWEVGH